MNFISIQQFILEIVKGQIDLECNEKGNDHETTSLKPELTSDEPKSTPDKSSLSTCSNERKAIFNVNAATKDSTIVEASENPYYEGL